MKRFAEILVDLKKMETHLFYELSLKGPEDWTWEANGTLKNSKDSSEWRWQQRFGFQR